MNFSICIPTRNRPDNINRLVSSIMCTASDIDKIQFVFRIDKDDNVSKSVIKLLHINYDIVLGERGDLSDMWEDCYPSAISDLIMMCADDVEFKTDNWDGIILDRIDSPKEKPYYLWGNDLIQGSNLATLPIVSRKWVDLVGYFVPRGYVREYCDTHLFDIARRVQEKFSNTVYYFDNIVFEHMHPGHGKSLYDDTYKYRLGFVSPIDIYRKREKERIEIAENIMRNL